MKLKKLLTPDAIIPELKSTTKDQVIAEMVDYMLASGRIDDRQAVLECIIERERKMSTGMQCGIAIPHGKTDAVNDLKVLLGIHPEGIDFKSLDGEPARIFVMTVSPLSRTGPHIQFLAEISRLLNNPSVRERLLTATSAPEIAKILMG